MTNKALFKNDRVYRDLTIEKKYICKNILESNFCKFGDNCRFSHDLSKIKFNNENKNYCVKISNSNNNICRNFLKYGNCKFGDNCKFSHKLDNLENGSNSKLDYDKNESNNKLVNHQNKLNDNEFFPELSKLDSKIIPKKSCWNIDNNKIKDTNGVNELNKSERNKINFSKKIEKKEKEDEKDEIPDFFNENDDFESDEYDYDYHDNDL